MDPEYYQHRIKVLLDRLERISADSTWAHRASGFRGSLLLILDQLNSGENVSSGKVNLLITQGYEILAQALNDQKRVKSKKA